MSSVKDYRFMDKDPVIDLIRTGFKLTGANISEVAEKAFVSEKTINRWLHGDTKRPQNITADCVLWALGIRREATWIETGKLLEMSPKFRIITSDGKRRA